MLLVMHASYLLIGVLLMLRRIGADWVYPDFNSTQGLILNGDAVWTDCVADNSREAMLDAVYFEDNEASSTRVMDTAGSIDKQNQIGFGHRESVESKDICSSRIRLTQSKTDQRGSLWYRLSTPIGLGFETLFTFQISSQSKHCTRVRDFAFSLDMYQSCYVHGGDGMAFVIQLDPNRTLALGQGGRELGYGGISHSLALELDMNYNPPLVHSSLESGDAVPVDHLEIRSRGTEPNSAYEPEALLAPLALLPDGELADGQEHSVKVAYKPYLDLRYFNNFSVTSNAAKYILDGGENRRLGLLLVWIDQGISSDSPALAIPINLPELLGLPGDARAFLGFTAATGLKWQNHDLTSWFVCDRPDCEAHPDSKERLLFDYHTSSKTNGPYKRFQYAPGPGYGYGGDTMLQTAEDRPDDAKKGTRHTSPDASFPLGPGPKRFPTKRVEDLASDAADQVPPHTVL